jgi:adenylate cyclase
MPEPSSRRLAAILFADIAGYTALMQHDEQDALQKLARFKETLEAKTAEFQGQIIQYYGDGCLVVFDSPAAAVACAMEMQRSFQSLPRQVGDDKPVPVRIGLHLGDVVFREGNVFGDSVNIASRVESLGVPGAVLLSQTVRRQIKNKPEFELVSLGSFDFKNVDEPMEVFAVANEGFPVPKREDMKGKLKAEEVPTPPAANFKKWAVPAILAAILAIAGWYFFQQKSTSQADKGNSSTDKSIAVLPFTDMSPNKDQEYFSLGMMDEILNHLFKIEGLQVTSRTSVMQYANTVKPITEIAKELGVANLLEGSVRKDGNQVRITVQLINGKTDKRLWGETYDKQLTDIFGIQSDVAQSIAGVLQTEIYPEVKARMETQPTTNLEAYDLWLRGNDTDSGFSDSAAMLYQQAIKVDPNFAPAYASLGDYWMTSGSFASRTPREEIIPKATYYLDKAVELDKDYPEAHRILASFYLWYHWDFEAAGKEFEIYQKLNPSSLDPDILDFYNASGRYKEAFKLSEKIYKNDPSRLDGWSRRGLAYTLSGDYKMGDYYYDKALERYPDSWYMLSEATRAYTFSGQYAKAISAANRLFKDYPDYRFPRVLGSLAIAYHHTSKPEKVKSLLDELKQRSEAGPVGSPAYYIAQVYAQMGEKDMAFKWLGKAYEGHEVEMYWLKVEPPFKPLYSDPRWQQMLDKMGFFNKIKG